MSQTHTGGPNEAGRFSTLTNRASDEATLFSVMAQRNRQSFLQLQGHQQREADNLAAREEVLRLEAELQHRQRTGMGGQYPLHRQLQAAISSPNPLLANPSPQTGLHRRVLGQESLALPGDLLLSPQERAREHVRQLQQQQIEEALRRDSSSSRGNHHHR